MILLNALRGVSARIHMPKSGAWVADVDIDLDTVPVAPTGKAVLACGLNIFAGTIDDRATGRFGLKGMARVVAGGGGWDTPLPPQHFKNDAGVLSTAIYAATAASVGEVVVEAGPPKVFLDGFARMKGAASLVFAGVDWYVDTKGITIVGPRVPLPAPIDAEVLSWDPLNKVAEIASDTLIVPGMILTDPIRFGVATVEDVEHVFDEGGARAIAWCSTPTIGAAATELLKAKPPSAGHVALQAIAAVARHACDVNRLRRYAYRVVVQGVDGRVNLQSTDLTAECPIFLRLADVIPGVAGATMKLAPASLVHVVFIDGRAIVVGFDAKSPPPLEVKFTALRVIAGAVGVSPAARADQVLAALTAICAAGGLAAPAMVAALAPFLATIPSTTLFTD